MRRVKRTRDFELNLEIKNESFIRPPRDAQRQWLINRCLGELVEDLNAVNGAAASFVPGKDELLALDREQGDLLDEDIMEDWQIPVMQAMTEEVARPESSVLEIGFGRGVASEMIQQAGVARHTIIDCNPSVLERCAKWRQGHAEAEIEVVAGRWEDTVGDLGPYDGVFFHTYPLSEAEFVERVAQSSTFAEHFFDTALSLLNPGGIFTYLTNEIDSLSRGQQRALLSRFSRIHTRVLRGLKPPQDTRDAFWGESMVVVGAEK